MPISGDVRINQDGLIPAVVDLTTRDAFAVAMVDGNGDQITGFDSSRPATSVLTQVAQSATSVVLKASNAARRQLFIYNDTNKELFIAFAATASLAAFTMMIPGKGSWELPLNGYTGIVSGIWSSAGAGNAMVTEVTA